MSSFSKKTEKMTRAWPVTMFQCKTYFEQLFNIGSSIIFFDGQMQNRFEAGLLSVDLILNAWMNELMKEWMS